MPERRPVARNTRVAGGRGGRRPDRRLRERGQAPNLVEFSERVEYEASSSGMAGMSGMSGTSTVGMEVNGVKAVASQLLASANWQGMRIEARTMTAAPFVIFNGTPRRPGQADREDAAST